MVANEMICASSGLFWVIGEKNNGTNANPAAWA